MAKLNQNKFRDEAKNRKSFGKSITNWRKAGETIGWIHPKLGIHYRYTHGMISIPDASGGKRFKYTQPIVCLGKESDDVPRIDCPFCSLGIWAREISAKTQQDSVILESGEGSDFRSYTLTDLIGGKNVEFRKRLTSKFDGLIPWIKKDTVADDLKNALEIHQATSNLVEKIIDTIDEQVSMRGSPLGEPTVPDGFVLRMKKGKLFLFSESNNELEWNPYPFKLRYNKGEIPANQYKVTKLDTDIFPVTPEIIQIMIAEADELDINFEEKETPTDPKTQLGYIKSIWVSRTVPFEMFLDFYQSRSGQKFTPQDLPEREEHVSTPAPSQTQAPDGKKFKCSACAEMVAPMKPSNRCPECGTKMQLDDVPF